MSKISAILIFVLMMAFSSLSIAGGDIEGKIRTIITDSRSAHTPNHGVIFIVFEGSTDRYYLPKDDPSFTFNQSALLAAFASKQNVYIQWEIDAISSSFDKKIIFVLVGEKPWG